MKTPSAPPELVKAIQSGDSLARVALADWFEEQGHPHADRARLMTHDHTIWERLSCEQHLPPHFPSQWPLAEWVELPASTGWYLPMQQTFAELYIELVSVQPPQRPESTISAGRHFAARTAVQRAASIRDHWHDPSRQAMADAFRSIAEMHHQLDPVATEVRSVSRMVEHRWFGGQKIWSPPKLLDWWDSPPAERGSHARTS